MADNADAPATEGKAIEPRPRYAAPALDKGLDILELLAAEPAGLTQSEMAERLGRTVGEIFRMVAALERRRFIASDGADRYALTLRLFELAHRHPPIRRLTTTAIPLMQKLVREVQQSCHLAVLNEDRLLVIAQVESPASMGFSVRLGARLSLVKTPSGHVILSFMEPAARAALLRASTERFDAAELGRHLDSIARQGHACVDSYEVRGVRPISYPIFDMNGDVAAALTIPYMERIEAGTASIDAARRLLGQLAQRITETLGGAGLDRKPPLQATAGMDGPA